MSTGGTPGVAVPPFVDAHHHLWDLEANRYAWLQQEPPPVLVCGDITPIRRSYRAGDLLADVAGLPLVGAVHVEAGWTGDPRDETVWVAAESAALGVPVRQVAAVQLADDGLEAALEGYAADEAVVGVREIMAWHPDPVLSQVDRPDLLDDPARRRGLSLVERYGLVFDLQVYPGQAAVARELLAALPDLVVAVEHTLLPAERTPSGRKQWSSGLRLLAEHPAAVLKITGLPMSLHAGSADTMRPYLEEALDAFGPQRCMLGSNFPVDSLHVAYRDLWEAFARIAAPLSEHERGALFRGTAATTYGLPL